MAREWMWDDGWAGSDWEVEMEVVVRGRAPVRMSVTSASVKRVRDKEREK
jgi:hypothetical protein